VQGSDLRRGLRWHLLGGPRLNGRVSFVIQGIKLAQRVSASREHQEQEPGDFWRMKEHLERLTVDQISKRKEHHLECCCGFSDLWKDS